MINRRIVLGLFASASALAATTGALAQKEKKEKKAKKHLNGSQLLGSKIKQNGKHKLAKAGTVDVEVDVRGGKVAALTAQHPQKGNLPVRKVKSKQRLADAPAPSVILAAMTSDDIKLAQYSDWYYGYWVEDADDDWYYWFTADEVYVDETWIVYS
jgi:hypothetical protein